MTHFHVTLPSNSSMNYYPDNKITRYVTRLQTPISLTGEWEVALVEISYPRSWFTVSQEGCKFLVSWWEKNETSPNGMNLFIEVQIPYGYYNEVEDIVGEMNNAIAKKMVEAHVKIVDTLKIKFDRIKRHVVISLPNPGYIVLGKQLATILGFSETLNHCNNLKGCLITGDMTCDIRGGIHGIYVYCDVLENVPVGDTLAPLLRIVDVDGHNGDTVCKSFNHPRYVPVQKKEFDSIEIDIRDDTGAPMSFENGKLVVTLHFKRVSNPYLL